MNLSAPILALAAVFVFAPAAIDLAEAQPFQNEERFRRNDARIELYAEPGFRGAQLTLRENVRNLADLRFNDRAASVRVFGGVWELCEDSGFDDRCVEVSRDEPDLARLGAAYRTSSVRRVDDDGLAGGPGWDGEPGWGGGVGGAVGRTAAFFPRPEVRGGPLPACDPAYGGGGRGCVEATAQRFCRFEGYRAVEYYSVRRGRRGDVLEDVLCVR